MGQVFVTPVRQHSESFSFFCLGGETAQLGFCTDRYGFVMTVR